MSLGSILDANKQPIEIGDVCRIVDHKQHLYKNLSKDDLVRFARFHGTNRSFWGVPIASANGDARDIAAVFVESTGVEALVPAEWLVLVHRQPVALATPAIAPELARYIFTWLRERNEGELDVAIGDMKVYDYETAIDELTLILQHGGKPKNWTTP